MKGIYLRKGNAEIQRQIRQTVAFQREYRTDLAKIAIMKKRVKTSAARKALENLEYYIIVSHHRDSIDIQEVEC